MVASAFQRQDTSVFFWVMVGGALLALLIFGVFERSALHTCCCQRHRAAPNRSRTPRTRKKNKRKPILDSHAIPLGARKPNDLKGQFLQSDSEGTSISSSENGCDKSSSGESEEEWQKGEHLEVELKTEETKEEKKEQQGGNISSDPGDSVSNV